MPPLPVWRRYWSAVPAAWSRTAPITPPAAAVISGTSPMQRSWMPNGSGWKTHCGGLAVRKSRWKKFSAVRWWTATEIKASFRSARRAAPDFSEAAATTWSQPWTAGCKHPRLMPLQKRWRHIYRSFLFPPTMRKQGRGCSATSTPAPTGKAAWSYAWW